MSYTRGTRSIIADSFHLSTLFSKKNPLNFRGFTTFYFGCVSVGCVSIGSVSIGSVSSGTVS